MGSPQKPTPEQYAQLEAGAQLQRLDGTRTVQANAGAVDLTFSLPEQSLSLIELEW
jgi:xylan 1,4-beta-xylosidase